MNESMEKILGQVGLNDREVKVYLAALELGESTVLPIANKASVKRTYCYDILADLEKKHFVTHIEKNGRRRYVVADPKNIEKTIKDHITNFQTILPELSALYKPNKEKPSVRFYEGPKEVARIYEEVEKAKQILVYCGLESIGHIVPGFSEFLVRVLSSKTPIRELAPRTAKTIEQQKEYKFHGKELRLLPDRLVFSTDNIIFDDKVAMISYGETVHGLLVESKAIAETQTIIFEELWKISTS